MVQILLWKEPRTLNVEGALKPLAILWNFPLSMNYNESQHTLYVCINRCVALLTTPPLAKHISIGHSRVVISTLLLEALPVVL